MRHTVVRHIEGVQSSLCILSHRHCGCIEVHLHPIFLHVCNLPARTRGTQRSTVDAWIRLMLSVDQTSWAHERYLEWPIYHSPVTRREMVKPSSPSAIRSTELI